MSKLVRLEVESWNASFVSGYCRARVFVDGVLSAVGFGTRERALAEAVAFHRKNRKASRPSKPSEAELLRKAAQILRKQKFPVLAQVIEMRAQTLEVVT